MKQLLSKSQFLRGLQCRKSLWLHGHSPELRTPPDKSQQTLFETGTRVGLLARDLFPGGTAVEFEGSSFEEKIARTGELIKAGVGTIYEATFSFDGVLVMVDILHHGEQGWKIYEVKSSTEVKDTHISDVAVQYYVLTGSGLPIAKASLVHINNQHVRYGDIDIKALFTITDLTVKVKERQDCVSRDLGNMQTLIGRDCPRIDIGPQCSDPYECDFTAHCWSRIPKPSVFDLSRLNSSRKFELYNQGIVAFRDIPETYPLNPGQRMQVQAHLEGKQFVDRGAIKEFFETLHYPLCFLDFETFQSAVPLFDGIRPYEQIPFQYSLHGMDWADGDVRHYEFLAEAGTDPRGNLVKRLVADIPSDACVLAYNMGFEKGVIKRLAERFSPYTSTLMAIHDNILDLMAPFRNRCYYTKDMNGSYSIKCVLPALVPDMGYEGMAVSNGGEAMLAYAKLFTVKDKNETESIRRALLEYCKLDTLAMVKLLDVLKRAGGNR